MSGPNQTGMISGLLVTAEIKHASDKLPDYPLLPGDLLIEQEDGTFYKFAPGLGVGGFRLTADQRASLKPSGDVGYGIGDMAWFLSGDDA